MASGTGASASEGLDRFPGSRRTDRVSQHPRTQRARRHGARRLVRSRALSGPELLFQRLINPAALSLPDGLTTAAVEHQCTSGDEQTLAELTGPGAVIQIWRSKPSGHISFYFDGQKQPAIDCLANLLREHVPHMTDETDPVFTCLPFAKQPADCAARRAGRRISDRIHQVSGRARRSRPSSRAGRFCREAGCRPSSIASISTAGERIARKIPRRGMSGEVDKLEAGQSAPLVKLDGAGIVQWLKLQGSPELLQNDDLWIEVRQDGQSEPLLAAPARYYFPALGDSVPLVGGTANHYNFVNVFRGGFTNMLAMPFADGLSITARNAGKQGLGKITVVTSVLRDDESGPAASRLNVGARMRLCGSFLPASDARELVSLSGAGRLVGLVWSPTEKSPGGIASLAIDGHDQSGWTQGGLDAFLGGWPGEKGFFRALSGRHKGLAWRYLLSVAARLSPKLAAHFHGACLRPAGALVSAVSFSRSKRGWGDKRGVRRMARRQVRT